MKQPKQYMYVKLLKIKSMKKMFRLIYYVFLTSIFLYSCKKTGCTDPSAKNFNPVAKTDDGTCKYSTYGCTDRNALNYDPGAEHDNGKCQYPAGYVPGSLSNGNENNGSNTSSGNNDNVLPKKEQNVAVIKWTGTQCSICGSSGSDAIKSMKNHSNKVRVLQAHVGVNDPMYYYPNFLSNHWPTGGGIPKIYVMDSLINLSSTNYNAYIDQIVNQSPLASLGFSTKTTGTNLEVTGKVRFWDNAPAGSTYEIGVYLLENGIGGGSANSTGYYDQLGNNESDYLHHEVIRATNALININGDHKNGDLLDFNTSFTINPDWVKNNLKIVAVIFEKKGTEYNFINCN